MNHTRLPFTGITKPALKLSTRMICLLLLNLCQLLQRITLYLLRKKCLSRKEYKKLLAWHAQLNEAAVRWLRR